MPCIPLYSNTCSLMQEGGRHEEFPEIRLIQAKLQLLSSGRFCVRLSVFDVLY